MKSIYLSGMVLLLVVTLNGCARIQETTKVIWGSSTRALDEARSEAISKVYHCRYEECFREVMKIAELEKFVIFIKDKIKKHIVFMGIKGSVNTTEVGVFFIELNDEETRVEVSSLSTNAKKKVSEMIFPQLGQVFTEQIVSK